MNKDDMETLRKLFKTPSSYLSINDNLDKIREQLKNREEAEDSLRRQVKDLKQQLEEKTSDDRVKIAEEVNKHLIKMSAAGFFNEAEKEAYDRINKEHYDTKCKYNLHMEVHWTGVGTAYVLKCPKCGLEVNITDYSEW